MDQYQNLGFRDPYNLDYDAYVYKYDINDLNDDLPSDYLYEKKQSMQEIENFITWLPLSSNEDL